MAEGGIEPIAVVGMSVRVPGAETLAQFWSNLRDGVESIHFFSDEELRAAGVAAAELANPDYVKASGALRDIELFDADFFGFTPREAETLDPQHRVFLECSWRALEHAGCDPERYDGRIAVYGGVGLNGYLIHNLLGHRDLLETLGGWQLSLGNDKDFAASRVSYKLNLQGPSVAVNTACSTSLVATALGCQSLLSYQCDMVLAGGCSIHLPQDRGYLYHPGGTLSPDGHCRPFDAAAAGTIDGNGAAIVALKRLEDALDEGDQIHGLIRGFAVNNDGDLKVGYTAPSVEGQAEVVREAQEMAGVSADEISYVETHGTGTDLGDPIEITALTEAFRASTQQNGYCAVGSVKSNIGHLDTAAGTASLIKTLLAMRHGHIPPMLHFAAPNPKIDFVDSPFYVNTQLQDWPRTGGQPRRAGVSSFGIGGTNAHIVVEEAPDAEGTADDHGDRQLLVLSAHSAEALDEQSAELAAHLQAHPEQSLADVAHTLQVGRREFAHRRCALVANRDDALQALVNPGAGRAYSNHAAAQPPVVFLFSGQDVQYRNMAAALRKERVFAEAIAECADLLTPRGIELQALIWPGGEPGFDPEFALDPVPLFALEYALVRQWQHWGVEPAALLGYSLGEYAAAVLAGVMSIEEALLLAAVGRECLGATEQGALLGVALSEDDVREDLGDDVHLAMVNGPRQCVLGGLPAAIEELHQRLQAKGVTAQVLPIARAFHTPFMQPFADAFRGELANVDLHPPNLPYISCLTGDWISDAEATDPEHYLALATSTVRLDRALATLFANDICTRDGATLLEVSPGQALSSLAAQHPRRTATVEILSSLRDPRYRPGGPAAQHDDLSTLLTSLGRLWTRGITVDWDALCDGRRRVPLPGHPLRRQRYWVDPPQQGATNGLATVEHGKLADMERWFYAPGWQRRTRTRRAIIEPQRWLILTDESGLADVLVENLRERGEQVVVVRHGADLAARGDEYALDTTDPDALDRLLSDLNDSARQPQRMVHMGLLGFEGGEADYLQRGFYSLLYLGRALGRHCFTADLELILLSDGLLGAGDPRVLQPAKAAALGPLRVIPQEYPNIAARAIDVSAGTDPQTLLAELDAEHGDPAVALRGANRWVEDFAPLPLPAPTGVPQRLREGGTYVITGGLGNIGLALAEYLWQATQANIVLTGRVGLPPEDQWPALAADTDTDELTRQRVDKVMALRQAGAEVLVLATDTADPDAMERAFTEAEKRFGSVQGVVHAAGLVGEESFATIKDCARADCDKQFLPKLGGVAAIEQVLEGRTVDFCALCSSLSPILGGLGFSAYAAANIYLDAVTERGEGAVPWLDINWEGWRFADEDDAPGAGAGVAELGLTAEEGVAAFARLMHAEGINRVVVSTGPLQQRIAEWIGGQGADGASGAVVAGGDRPAMLGDPIPAGTPTEEALVALWQQLLGIEAIGTQDNFFELGGNSLLLTQLVALMRRGFQVDFSLAELFNTPTVGDIAAQIDGQRDAFADEEREVGEI